MSVAASGDLVYLDPPYAGSQKMLYGAHSFRLVELFDAVARCKQAGVAVALSLDGSGTPRTPAPPLHIPPGLFEREILIDCGRSLLRNLQAGRQTDPTPRVDNRLLPTY